jgi:membrane associated rhomboid family serine protease
LWQGLVVATTAVSVLVLYRIAKPGGGWARRLRSRLLLGIPWGTLSVLAFLLGVFLFVQGAYSGEIFDPRQPVTYAFTAWSYDYPLGVLTAAFSHGSFGHFFGNAVALVVFGSITEYAYGHFPLERGAQAHRSVRESPYARPLVFVGVVLGVGLLTAAFSPGPIIGFSGVTYALAGFAIVYRPLSALSGLLVVDVVRLLYSAFTSPVQTYSPSVQSIGVWFADVAVLGHLLGFLVGIGLAFALLGHRDERPASARVWIAAVVYGLVQNLWLVYLPLDNSRYLLLRGVGVAFVFLVAAVVLAGVTRPSRPAIPWPSQFSSTVRDSLPSRGAVATMFVIVSLLSLSMAGAATHLRSVDSTALPNDPVEIRDYQVGYSENVSNEIYSLDVPGLSQGETVQSSGVIVYSEQRHVWQVATSTSRLASNGVARVVVGGVGWRETVWVTRTGWSVVGGAETYRVQLYPPDAEPRLAFASDPATAEAVIDNRSIALRPSGTDFEIAVSRNNETLGVETLPDDGANTTVGAIRFERRGRNLYAASDGTRLRIANKKIPPTRRD